jgi:hypothetical protein
MTRRIPSETAMKRGCLIVFLGSLVRCLLRKRLTMPIGEG